MDRRIAAVVVTYNRKELLGECLEALLGQSRPCFDILVIDNASTDGTRELAETLGAEHREILYLNTGANLGGAGGFSFGIREGVRRGYEYLWLMDDDTIPRRDALEELLAAAEKLDYDFGYLSSTAVWTDGSYCRMNWQRVNPENWLESYRLLQEGIIPVREATFVSVLVSARAVRQAGLPKKEYFIWGDDMEYTARLSGKFPCYYVAGSVAVHKMGSNGGSDIATDRPERISRYRYAYRNELSTAMSHSFSEVVLYFVRWFRAFARVLVSKAPCRGKRIGVMLRGMAQGLFFHPRTEYVEEPPEG